MTIEIENQDTLFDLMESYEADFPKSYQNIVSGKEWKPGYYEQLQDYIRYLATLQYKVTMEYIEQLYTEIPTCPTDVEILNWIASRVDLITCELDRLRDENISNDR